MIARRLQSNWKDHVTHFDSAEKALDAAASAGAERSELADPFTRTQIHVAGGMVAVQLGVHADEAVDRLRTYSFACSAPSPQWPPTSLPADSHCAIRPT